MAEWIDLRDCHFVAIPQVSGWISVKDRLPNDHQDYLVYYAADDAMAVGACFDDGWETDICWAPKGPVTHWMPLPEVPNV